MVSSIASAAPLWSSVDSYSRVQRSDYAVPEELIIV